MKRITGLISAAALVFTVACGQTDAGITSSVKSKLAADEMVKAYEVDVDTSNKVVTLSGEVETMAAKERAVQLARNTEGVTDVIDRLRVGETAATSGELDVDADGPDVDVDADADVDVDPELRREADAAGDRAAEAVKRGAEATKSGAEKAADATVEGARKAGQATVDATKKAGSAVRDAVTDDDRDSDNDGK